MLNLSAWLLVEILGEDSDADPWPAFYDAVRHTSPPEQAREMMREGLQQLARFGLLELDVTIPRGGRP
jgi:hypothetical protein